jgi:hypothetical protein
MTNTKFMIIFILVQKLVSLIFQSLNYTVIKPDRLDGSTQCLAGLGLLKDRPVQ